MLFLYTKALIIHHLTKENQDFLDLPYFDSVSRYYIEDAFNFKLNPSYVINDNIIDYYFSARDIFLKQFLHFLNLMYNKNFQSWYHYLNSYFLSPRVICLRMIHYIRLDKSYYNRIILNTIQLFVLSGLSNSGTIDKLSIKLANKQVNKINNYKNNYFTEWSDFRNFILLKRM